MPGNFRDIELSILNADTAHVYLNQYPGFKQVYANDFDSDYNSEGTIHISNIPDGKYFLQVFSKDTVRELTFEYTGRKSLSLFIFFCLIFSFKAPERDIEIHILNSLEADFFLLKMPEGKVVYHEMFDRNYVKVDEWHIKDMPDGKYKFQVISFEKLRDTTFMYTGKSSLTIRF
ncbi:hypothetical protein ACFP1I_22370 [Dyadobacter subterraneus]|uniref:Uncharacterized protein n=1 Tax=Dyadobacter subterraneus TaxID=2773304 RepID=A0ABR9WIZ5_9BACT|nr:hypothetical protein [Dyadobacter subterraneus]MBE9465488.1 hypothetical protein [Dyadobacter subterraneus]